LGEGFFGEKVIEKLKYGIARRTLHLEGVREFMPATEKMNFLSVSDRFLSFSALFHAPPLYRQ
jgi:hypothetical protein